MGQSGTGRQPLGSSTLGASTSRPAGQSQHEILQNFFMGLLSSRDRGATASAATGISRPASGAQNGTSTISQNGAAAADAGANGGGSESAETNGEGSSGAE